MLKIIKFFILLAFITFTVYSQTYFQKITSGSIVNTYISSNRCAWGDYDNDGFQDLVISGYSDNCWNCNYPLLLFHNNGDQTFTQVTTGPIASYTGKTMGVAWGDYDNDGKLDLFVCGWGGSNLLFHNEGNGNFTQVTSGIIVIEGGLSQCCAWCDYDRDGWIDLFVGCSSASQSSQNSLYHNNGNGTFTKITTGSIVTDVGYSRGCAWGDYDNDGWPDLFVVNYKGQSDYLYHNNGNGTFTKIYNNMTSDQDWGSGCAWADFDNDGYLDLYITNNSTNNKLYRNNGDGTFYLTYLAPSLENGYSFGGTWEDYDNDGWIDLFVAKQQTNNALYKNIGGTFVKVTNEVVCYEGMNSAYGIWGDYNNDGKMDLFVANTGSPVINYLYKNIGNTGNYLTCKLVGGCGSNKAAIGARIKLYSGNLFCIREVSGGCSMGVQNILWQHFGLGDHTIVDSILVYWPTGNTPKIQRVRNIAANQTITINECQIGIKNNRDELPSSYELQQNYPNPFNPTTKINYQIPKSTFINLEVYDYLGRKVTTLINLQQPAGYYEVDFNGEDYSSGIYFYKLTAGDFRETKKMILVK